MCDERDYVIAANELKQYRSRIGENNAIREVFLPSEYLVADRAAAIRSTRGDAPAKLTAWPLPDRTFAEAEKELEELRGGSHGIER